MMGQEMAEIMGIRSALVSIIKDLKMLEARIATLEYVAASDDTIEVEVDDPDSDFPSAALVDDVGSYDAITTRQGLEDWRNLSRIIADDKLIDELKGD